jgi:hypothetical protein
MGCQLSGVPAQQKRSAPFRLDNMSYLKIIERKGGANESHASTVNKRNVRK